MERVSLSLAVAVKINSCYLCLSIQQYDTIMVIHNKVIIQL